MLLDELVARDYLPHEAEAKIQDLKNEVRFGRPPEDVLLEEGLSDKYADELITDED